VDNNDYDFSDSLPAFTPSQADESFYIGIAIQGIGLSLQAFEFEAYSVFEAYGRNIRAMTPSHVDPVGFGAVHALTQLSAHLKPSQDPSSELEKRFLGATAKYVSDSTTTYQKAGKTSFTNPGDMNNAGGKSALQDVTDFVDSVSPLVFLFSSFL
jgi:hypothetical protein